MEWENSLKPKGRPGPELTLALNGKAQYIIVLPAKPTPQDEWAAAELQNCLDKMTAAQFSKIYEGAGDISTSKVISVGYTQLLKDEHLAGDEIDLADEEYAIAVKSKNLFLFGGNKRGPIYAVYALLEEDLGCRWYDSSGPVVPFRPNLTFNPVPRHSMPAFDIRDLYCSGYISGELVVFQNAFNPDWALANRLNGWTTGIPDDRGGCVRYAGTHEIGTNHTLQNFLPKENVILPSNPNAKHFSVTEGKDYQICLSVKDENDFVFKEVERRIIDLLAKYQGAVLISVAPNDNENYCPCEKCSAFNCAEETNMGTLLVFVNRIAESVEKTFPNRDVKVSTLAYGSTLSPPKSDTLIPRQNVVIWLCTDSHTWRWPFCSVKETKTFQSAMKEWKKKGATVLVWDYPMNYSHYLLPMPNMQVVSDNLNFFLKHGATGVMLQGEGPGQNHEEGINNTPATENAVMRYWVWAKQLWDPSRDTRRLMHDFIYGYFGEAAEPLWEYNNMLWNLWKKLHNEPHRPDTTEGENPLMTNTNRFPPKSCLFSKQNLDLDQAMKLFEQAEILADSQVIRNRVKLAKLPLLYTLLCQGLGYSIYRGEGQYLRGTVIDAPTPGLISKYSELLDEFAFIIQIAGITRLSDFGHPDAQRKIAKWRDVLRQLGDRQ